jgi:hypothetical protein
MPYINLIQEQRSASRSRELQARAGFFAFVGISVVCAGAYGALLLKGAEGE